MKITDKMIREIASSTIYSRGISYFKAGRVHLKQCKSGEINALVDGENLYNVQIRFNSAGIDYIFCSCPYFSTMNCACKHIVAAAKQYQADFSNNRLNSDAEAAGELCGLFEKSTGNEILPLEFCVNIITPKYKNDKGRYSLQIKNKMTGENIDTARLANAYLNHSEMRVGRKLIYSPEIYTFTEHDRNIMNFIAKTIDNADAVYSQSYHMLHSYISIGAMGLKELIEISDIELCIDGEYYSNLKKYYENPDILVDISAMEGGINMSVSDTGLAVVPDGEWFLFEGDLYKTDAEFRSWYMPVYTAMHNDHRDKIEFKKDTAVRFVNNVLPHLRNRHGVTEKGLEDLIIDSEPIFSVYLDKWDNMGISAVIRVSYGDISFILPENYDKDDKILLRDNERETYIMSYFNEFSCNGIYYMLYDDALIYKFINETFPDLTAVSSIYYTDAFKNVLNMKKPGISIKANYKNDIDLFEMSFDTELDNDEIIAILESIKAKNKYYRMKDGSFLNIENNPDLDMFELMSSLGFDEDDIYSGTKKLEKNNMMYIFGFDEIEVNSEALELYEKFKDIKAEIPDGLKNILRDYQKTGVNWLTQLSAFSFGGILADDMGLGKTLQVIAFISSQDCEFPALIVTPSSLIYNWQNEIDKFMPSKTSVIIDGKKAERNYRLERYREYDFVITSYPLLRRDIEEYKDMKFEYCFIDEAQHIKNPKTMNADSVKRINAKHKFALTGTPIENSLTELWSIFDFIMPGYLYSHNEFTEKFERPVSRGSESAVKQLKAKIAPFLLRRMKNDVLNELPEKVETVMYAEMTAEQKKIYAANIAVIKNEILGWEDIKSNRIQILAMLIRLRQICCHPSLIVEDYKKGSGKLSLLEELLEDSLSSGHRVIVYSQFTSMLDIIKRRLDVMGISSFYLSGKTRSSERMKMVGRFNGGENDVFLISLKAGGTGLNLTGADTVIHYDPWWNQAVMEQASDRVYRIGQTKNVHIINLLAKGTIEEKIMLLQKEKKNLADNIITTDNVNIGNMTKEELMAILS